MAEATIIPQAERSIEDLSEARDQPLGDHAGWVRGSVEPGRITKVGLWLTLLTLILSVAAANTGNNSLYLVIAACSSLLFVSWGVARANVKGLEFKVSVPDEIHAGSPVVLNYAVRRLTRGVSTELLLLIEGSRSGTLLRRLSGPSNRFRRLVGTGNKAPLLVSSAAEMAEDAKHDDVVDQAAGPRVLRGDQEALFLNRGVHRIGQAKALSLFPMGLFRRQVTFRSSQEVIVLPELFSGLRTVQEASPRGWRESGPPCGSQRRSSLTARLEGRG